MVEGICENGCLAGVQFSDVADVAQILMTVIAAYIAYQAHSYTRKAAKSNFIISTTKLLNGINETSISSREHADALLRLRPGVSDDIHKDYIALMNMNYLFALWSLREENVIDPQLVDSKLKNGVGFLSQSSDEYAEGLLKRGFPDKFRNEMMTYFRQLPRRAG